MLPSLCTNVGKYRTRRNQYDRKRVQRQFGENEGGSRSIDRDQTKFTIELGQTRVLHGSERREKLQTTSMQPDQRFRSGETSAIRRTVALHGTRHSIDRQDHHVYTRIPRSGPDGFVARHGLRRERVQMRIGSRGRFAVPRNRTGPRHDTAQRVRNDVGPYHGTGFLQSHPSLIDGNLSRVHERVEVLRLRSTHASPFHQRLRSAGEVRQRDDLPILENVRVRQ